MSSCYRRVILGAAVMAWTTSAAAQQQPAQSNVSSETFAADTDRYVADDAASDVVEFPQDMAASQGYESAPQAYAEAQPAYEADPPQQASSQCTEYEETVVAHGETRSAHGTACQQPDGSWHIIGAPPADRQMAENDAPAVQPRGSDARSYCREYRQTIYANGRAALAYGRACLQPDGSWRVVTPPSMEVASADYQRPIQHHVTSASERAAEGRGYMSRGNSGTTYYYTIRPRHSPLYNLFFRWID